MTLTVPLLVRFNETPAGLRITVLQGGLETPFNEIASLFDRAADMFREAHNARQLLNPTKQ